MITPKEVRKRIVDISKSSNNPHIPSSLSTVEILLAIYSIKTDKDIFVLSKGHGCMGWYAILEDLGYNPPLKHHPDICPKEGIVCTTGSLGHGLPIAVGMAIAKKILKEAGIIYVLIGDGECQEGTIWESISIAVHYELDNIIIIVDNNGIQALDFVSDVNNDNAQGCTLYDKFESFGCSVVEVDGHNVEELLLAFTNELPPLVIIAETIKGKGVKFMENKPEFHAKQLSMSEYEQAYEELENA